MTLDFLKGGSMRRYLIFGVLLLIGLGLKAQYGLRLNYISSSAPNWELIQNDNISIISPVVLYQNGYKVGLDYWTRLPQKRVEFYPEIAFSTFKSTAFGPGLEAYGYKGKAISAILNTNFYLLDFTGDCDCPTFSKKGNLFKKGFFLSTHIGGQWHTKNSFNSVESSASIAPTVGAGLGLDIGLTDLITITPYIQYQLAINDEWESLATDHNRSELIDFETSSFQQFHFGIRVGFRPDYK